MTSEGKLVPIRMSQLMKGDLWIRFRDPKGRHLVTGYEKRDDGHILLHYKDPDGSVGQHLTWPSTHAWAIKNELSVDSFTGDKPI